MARNYDKTYLDGLIAKAKKSWQGVDVDSYMSDLRDDSFDKEVAENLSKEVASYITEQMKSNMDKATIKCRALMVGDWCCDKHGFPMRVTNVGDDYAYATFEGNEGDPWEFDDKDDQPEPIMLTPEILEKNGFYGRNAQGYYTQWYYKRFGSYVCFDIAISLVYREIEVSKVCGAGTDCEEEEYGSSIVFGNDICVHTLQHALRLCGLDELADNFKI